MTVAVTSILLYELLATAVDCNLCLIFAQTLGQEDTCIKYKHADPGSIAASKDLSAYYY